METVDRWVSILVAAWPLLVLLAGIIYPFLPGPVRAWLLAQKTKAASDTHLNDTRLLLETLWRGYQDAKARGLQVNAAVAAAIVYASTNRKDLVDKLRATPAVMAAMLGAQVQDRKDLLQGGVAAGATLSAREYAELAQGLTKELSSSMEALRQEAQALRLSAGQP